MHDIKKGQSLAALVGRISGLCLLILSLGACSIVTIKPNGGNKLKQEPSYQTRKAFYFAGLKGEHTVDVNEICEGGEVLQMQTVVTSNDYLLGLSTLFIYAPRTVKVWCSA